MLADGKLCTQQVLRFVSLRSQFTHAVIPLVSLKRLSVHCGQTQSSQKSDASHKLFPKGDKRMRVRHVQLSQKNFISVIEKIQISSARAVCTCGVNRCTFSHCCTVISRTTTSGSNEPSEINIERCQTWQNGSTKFQE